jgi:ribosomal protein S18 acetylase RimI-like enzyme
MNQDLIIRLFEWRDEAAVVNLWQACGLIVPQNDPRKDIRLKMNFQPGLFFVGEADGKLIATVMAGYEGHRGWINYLAVHPDYQRQGLGRRLMDQVEQKLKSLGCVKINLQVRETNTKVIQFYNRLGYKTDRVVSLGKRLSS